MTVNLDSVPWGNSRPRVRGRHVQLRIVDDIAGWHYAPGPGATHMKELIFLSQSGVSIG